MADAFRDVDKVFPVEMGIVQKLSQIVDRLNGEINEILKNPLVQQRAQVTGQEIVDANSPAQFREFIRGDHARWSAIAQKLKLKLEIQD